MKDNRPSIDDWRALYEAARHVKEAEPWSKVTEGQIFGLRNPESGEQAFVAVLGSLGEHRAVLALRGAKGLYRFRTLQSGPHPPSFQQLMETPMLELSFVDRDQLWREDHDIMKALGLRFRGGGNWPQFRSYRPGFFPWFLEADEVRFLTHALEQTLEVVDQLEANPDLLPDEPSAYLVRVPRDKNGDVTWEQRVESVTPPDEQIDFRFSAAIKNALKDLKRGQFTVEADLTMLPEPVQEGSAPPFYPYMLLVADSENGLALGHELLTPTPSPEAMWATVPESLAGVFLKLKILPAKLLVSSVRMEQAAKTMATDLDIEITVTENMPHLNQIRRALFQNFGG